MAIDKECKENFFKHSFLTPKGGKNNSGAKFHMQKMWVKTNKLLDLMQNHCIDAEFQFWNMIW